MSKDNEQEMYMSYEYDSLNRLKAVLSPLGRVRYTYDKANRLIDEESSNGVQTSYDFYPSGNIRRITYHNNGTVTDKLYYEYDKVGNRLVEQNDEYIKEYTYDGINRLISSDKDREYYTYYEYDLFNNLKTVYELTNGETYKTVYEYDKNNRLVFKSDDTTASFYEYDNKGNLIKTRETDYDRETETLYFYDGYNRLAEILKDDNIISYSYDYDGIRNSKTVNGIKTAFITDNGNVIAEYTEEKSNRYFRGNSLIGSVNELNEGFYYSRNAHGDIISLLDYKGDSLNDYSYTDWGAIEETADQNFFGGQFKNLWQQETETKYETPFSYAGEYQDLCSGLIYLRNRYYDPSIGRFISEDPIRSGTNWYVYANNNPVNYIDPLGLDAIVITNENSVNLGVTSAGHTSAIYQNADGHWFYTYWGNKAAAVIRIPDTYVKEWRRNGDVTANSMDSLSDFNNVLNNFLSANGFENITSNYTDATYIVGDFTASLAAAYDDIDTAYNNWFSKGTLTTLDDGSKVFQGHNSPYNVGYRNCFDRTYASLSKGTLADGRQGDGSTVLTK